MSGKQTLAFLVGAADLSARTTLAYLGSTAVDPLTIFAGSSMPELLAFGTGKAVER